MSSEVTKKPANKPFQKFRDGKKPNFNKFKRANKKNQKFFQNAKSFAKKGSFGRGTHIEEEDFTYFMGILETQQKKVLSLEEKVNMADNVMQQTKGKEIHLSSNQVVSKVLENSLGYVDSTHLERFFEVFGEVFRPVCSDSYASYVLQKLIEVASVRAVGQNVIDTDIFGEEEGASAAKKPRNDIVTDVKYNMTQEFAEEHRTKCAEFVLRISKFLLNNLEDFIQDRFANHLLRAAILTLAGVYIPKGVYFKGRVVDNTERLTGLKSGHHEGKLQLNKTVFKVPDEWLEIMKEFPERLGMWPQFKDLPYKYTSSGLLQVICIALHTTDKKSLDAFGKKLIAETFMDVEVPKTPYYENQKPKNKNEVLEEEANGNGVDEEMKSKPAENDEEEEDKEEEDDKAEEDDKEEEADKEKENGEPKEEEENDDEEMPSVFKSDSAVRLLQTLLSLASPKLLNKIYDLIKDRVVCLANKKSAYYALERFVNYVADKSQFEAIFDELCPHFEKFLQQNKTSLVSALSGTCLRLKTKQAAYVTAMQNTLKCNASLGEDRPKGFFLCLTKLKPFDVLPYDKNKYVVLFGSLIIQDILQFNKPIFLVNGILETPVKDLMGVLLLPNGSYIVDKFLTSPTIGEKSREKFIKLFEGFYMDLAYNKNGSRVLDQLVIAASETQKVAIAKELTGKENKLKGSYFGRIIYNSLRLETFKLSPEQWKASWTAKGIAEAEDADAKEEVVENTEADETTENTTKSPKSAKKNKKNMKRPAC